MNCTGQKRLLEVNPPRNKCSPKSGMWSLNVCFSTTIQASKGMVVMMRKQCPNCVQKLQGEAKPKVPWNDSMHRRTSLASTNGRACPQHFSIPDQYGCR